MTMPDDERFMRMALAEARRAGRLGEVPVGAIVVARGAEGAAARISRGHNLMRTRHDPTAHAEVVALRRAGRSARNYRLTGSTLYVTLEPCLLCLGAIVHARVSRIVYGATDPKRGALEAARSRPVAGLLHHRYRVTEGVLERECSEVLKSFFKARRLAPAIRP